MAKESMKAREVKRAKLVAKFAARKAALKAEAKELAKNGESAYEVYQQLQKLPKMLCTCVCTTAAR